MLIKLNYPPLMVVIIGISVLVGVVIYGMRHPQCRDELIASVRGCDHGSCILQFMDGTHHLTLGYSDDCQPVEGKTCRVCK